MSPPTIANALSRARLGVEVRKIRCHGGDDKLHSIINFLDSSKIYIGQPVATRYSIQTLRIYRLDSANMRWYHK